MSKFTRRQLLIFFGASAGTAVLAPALEKKLFDSTSNITTAVESLKFTPVRLPHPLPIYTESPSFLATGNSQGQILSPSKDRCSKDLPTSGTKRCNMLSGSL